MFGEGYNHEGDQQRIYKGSAYDVAKSSQSRLRLSDERIWTKQLDPLIVRLAIAKLGH